MKIFLLCLLSISLYQISAEVQAGAQVQIILTNADQQFSQQPYQQFKNGGVPQGSVLSMDESQQYQTMQGFGAALTESSAYLLYNMEDGQFWNTLNQLFNPTTGLGISYLRLTISACDFSLSDYTYDDLQDGQTDPNLDHFSIERDQQYMIPVLQAIKQVNPSVKIMMTPWSPPAWMKTTGSVKGSANGQDSHMIKEYYPSLAKLFVKAIQAYENEGIHIDTFTIQNEPLFGPGGYPGLVMDQYEQSDFLNNHLAQAILDAGIQTKLYVYDHNWDRIDYPDYVLQNMNDQAKQIVGGAALHCYGGDVSAQSDLHKKYPNLDIYMTECSGGEWMGDFTNSLVSDMQNIFIGNANNWGQVTMKWNLILDQNDGPKNGGCSNCWGLLTVNTDNEQVTPTVDYYAVGTFSKYVPRGSVRVQVDSNDGNLMATGFIKGSSRTVIVLNQDWSDHEFSLSWQQKYIQVTIPAKTVGVYTW